MQGGAGGGLNGTNNNAQGSDTFEAAGGFTWVYVYPQKELAYIFAFNRDGRVVAILERGRRLGQPTSKGVGLGDPVSSIYKSYGWPDTLEMQGSSLALNYNNKAHAYFSVLNNKVTGIAVLLQEKMRVFFDDGRGPTTAAGGRGGYPGMMGGGMRPGMPGGGRRMGGGAKGGDAD